MNRVSNKVIIVTGGASGIGRATCKLLAREGATVALVDIDDEAGQKTVKEIHAAGFLANYWHMNAIDETAVKEVIDAVAEKWGAVHVLVNNVGMIGDNKPTHELTEAEWDRVMNLNTKSVFFCTKHAVPHLKKAGGGSIINISSAHGLVGTADYPANHASKGAVRLMSKTDAMLYAKDKIRVNSVHPGYIWTPLLEKATRETSLGESKIRELGLMGEADDVAYAILYLASDESKFVTASELVVDGGFTGGRTLEC